jgi:hypothetical protein
MKPHIGIDFDNTLASYDEVMHAEALGCGLIRSDFEKNKRQIRDAIQALPDGNLQWQKLQAVVYGPRMKHARLMEGAQTFLESCRRQDISITIVSHKSAHYEFDDTDTNFQQAAMEWMEQENFFKATGFGLSKNDVCFENTRQEKIQKIKSSGCTHFIDDLPEIFLEGSFPEMTEKILFGPHLEQVNKQDVQLMTNWKEITHYFFPSEC